MLLHLFYKNLRLFVKKVRLLDKNYLSIKGIGWYLILNRNLINPDSCCKRLPKSLGKSRLLKLNLTTIMKKLNKKLSLNKSTLASLDKKSMQNIKGGEDEFTRSILDVCPIAPITSRFRPDECCCG